MSLRARVVESKTDNKLKGYKQLLIWLRKHSSSDLNWFMDTIIKSYQKKQLRISGFSVYGSVSPLKPKMKAQMPDNIFFLNSFKLNHIIVSVRHSETKDERIEQQLCFHFLFPLSIVITFFRCFQALKVNVCSWITIVSQINLITLFDLSWQDFKIETHKFRRITDIFFASGLFHWPFSLASSSYVVQLL